MKVIGEALFYISSYTKGSLKATSCEDLIRALKKRFSNAVNTDIILKRFLMIKSTNSYKEYVNLLKDASTLVERDCIVS